MASSQGNLNAGISINPFEYPTMRCKSCGNDTFIPAMMFRQVPGMLVGQADAKTVDVPIKVFICAKCHELSPTDKELIDEATKEQQKPKSNLIIE